MAPEKILIPKTAARPAHGVLRSRIPLWQRELLPLNMALMEEPIDLPIDGVLDLHTFRPKEIKELVPDYLAACRAKGIFHVRVIHGKGIGNLRRSVHAILGRLPEVVSFSIAGEHYGGPGATIVNLRPTTPSDGGAKD